MMRYVLFILFICSAFLSLPTQTDLAAQMSDLTIHPAVLNIGTFYSGGKVTVSGRIPNRQDILIEITGPMENDKFDLKGRVGPFWMTRDRVDMDGVPAMYVLLLPEGGQWRQQAADLGLGLVTLESNTQISLQSAKFPPKNLFKMFVDLKKSEGLYLLRDSAIHYSPDDEDYKRFRANFQFPRATTAGVYTIKAYAVSDGAILSEQSRGLMVDEVGLTRLIDYLATHRRLIYGVLAVVIALCAGAAMGILFKGGGSH